MDFKVISKHRGKLMGLAIISIILFHYLEDVRVVNNASLGLIKIAQINHVMIGSGGVDIFIMLSAIGLYFSYTKNNNIKEFYTKRIKRVLIPYIFLCGGYWIIFDLILKKTTLKVFLKDFLWISFFTEHITTFWYIFGILVLYFIFPFVYKFINSGKNYKIRILILIIANLLLNAAVYILNRTLYDNIEIFSC